MFNINTPVLAWDCVTEVLLQRNEKRAWSKENQSSVSMGLSTKHENTGKYTILSRRRQIFVYTFKKLFPHFVTCR